MKRNLDPGGSRNSPHGKKRMREYGSASIPQEAFIAPLRMGEEIAVALLH